MKRLILMRHAKSSWEDGVADFDRPLNRRGARDAPRIASELSGRGWNPDIVIHSAAQRTTQTWELMASHFPEVQKVVSSKSLYHGSLPDIEEAVETLPADCGTSLLIGHNPGWELAVHQLSKQNERMTTANAALFEIEGDNWQSVFADLSNWKLITVLRPKQLGS